MGLQDFSNLYTDVDIHFAEFQKEFGAGVLKPPKFPTAPLTSLKRRAPSPDEEPTSTKYRPQQKKVERKSLDSVFVSSTTLADEQEEKEASPVEDTPTESSESDHINTEKKGLFEKFGLTSDSKIGKTMARRQAVIESGGGFKAGLGYEVPEEDDVLKTKYVHTKPNMGRFIPHEEAWSWLPPQKAPEPLEDMTVQKWFDMGYEECPADRSRIDFETFCGKKLVADLFKAKDKFGKLDSKTFMEARKKANPHEDINRAKNLFGNRAAVKMANLDHMASLLPPASHIPADKKFYFGDVCAGPGGFSQYVIHKLGSKCFGTGMTLVGENDFKIGTFKLLPQSFKAVYGEDNTGDIYKKANVKSYQAVIDERTRGVGLDLLMADGGFSTADDENFQEDHLKRLVLCQFNTALCTVRKGGDFVCKLFDAFMPFTVGLLYIMSLHFESIAIVKPFTSRPANSERYIICRNLRIRNPTVSDYLFDVNDKLESLEKIEKDVSILISLDKMSPDFIDYIRESNIRLATIQEEGCDALIHFALDPTIALLNQEEATQRCLTTWGIAEGQAKKTQEFNKKARVVLRDESSTRLSFSELKYRKKADARTIITSSQF